MILCQMETRSFSFCVLGRTERECLGALKKAWKVHARNSGADPKYLVENLDSVCYLSMEPGQVFCDGGLIKTP